MRKSQKAALIQFVLLTIIAAVAYAVALNNGFSLSKEKISSGEYQILTAIIIGGAYLATCALLIYAYRISISKEEQNQRLNDLSKSIHSIKQAIAIITKYDEIQWVNQGFEAMFGFSEDEAVGKKASELLAGPETEPKILDAIDQSVFKNKESFSGEIVHYRKDRSTLWARVYITPLLDEKGKLQRYIAVSEDITEELEAKRKLAKSEFNFREITNTIEDTVYLFSIEKNCYEFVSKNSLKTLGIRDEIFYQGNLTDHLEMKKAHQQLFKESRAKVAEGTPFSNIYRIKVSEQWKWIEEKAFPVFNETGRIKQYSGVFRDISEEIDIKEMLSQSEANFRQIAETLSDAIYLYNIEKNKYEFISENIIDVMGVPASDFYAGINNQKIKIHPSDIDLYYKATEKVNKGESYTIQYRLKVDDEWKWIEESSYPILDKDGKVISNSGICSDITASRKLQNELQEINKEVMASINYAKRMQNATLTNINTINEIFEENCLFYQPKDIVSGDFYNASVIKTNEGVELKSIVVADCTGHGVPGATLAIACSNIVQSTFTNPAINSPSQALNYIREQLNSLFDQSDDIIYDGMDVSWAVWNSQTNEMYFSGAFNNCYVVRDSEVITVKADRMHVAYTDKPKDFTTQVFQLEKDDCVFLTSDGYYDQFGGPDGKKLGRKRFFEVITTIAQDNLSRSDYLPQFYEEWKGDNFQMDDVCVFGFRVK